MDEIRSFQQSVWLEMQIALFMIFNQFSKKQLYFNFRYPVGSHKLQIPWKARKRYCGKGDLVVFENILY